MLYRRVALYVALVSELVLLRERRSNLQSMLFYYSLLIIMSIRSTSSHHSMGRKLSELPARIVSSPAGQAAATNTRSSGTTGKRQSPFTAAHILQER